MTEAVIDDLCELDPDGIDSFDYVDGNEVLALIWCDTHQGYHWRWVPKAWGGSRI